MLTEIKIVDPNTYNFPARHIGSKTRYDTMTACEFVSHDTIVCSNRQSAKLYLIRFDMDSWSLLDSIDTITDDGCLWFPEIIKRYAETYYATAYVGGYLTFKINVENRISCLSFHPINSLCCYHGLHIANNKVFLTDSKKDAPGIITMGIDHHVLPGLKKKRVKDLTQMKNGLWVVLASSSGPEQSPSKAYSSLIVLYSADFLLKDELILDRTHLDSVVHCENVCYITAQHHDKGYIFRVATASEGIDLETF